MNVLVGDIGGTKTILAIFSSKDQLRKPLIEMSFPSQHYQLFEDILREFLSKGVPSVEQACFAVAGPVMDNCARITNLPWVIDKANIQSVFGWKTVSIINDLEAVAYSIPGMAAEDMYTLSQGIPKPGGNIAVLAPGTGLGEAYLTYHGGRYFAHASEGSHVSFGPVGPLQIGLLSYMNQQGFEHVSYERICSGGLGIPNLFAYLKTTGLEVPAWLVDELEKCEDMTPVIMKAVDDPNRPCPIADSTLDLFVSILAAEAGNLALKILSTGGIYLGGGISPRILPYLQKPSFLTTLRRKGRFQGLLSDIPVQVIMKSNAGLIGAAAFSMVQPLNGYPVGKSV